MIFGPDGDMFYKQGNMTFGPGGKTFHESGGMTFGSDGFSMHKSGGMSFFRSGCGGSGTIRRTGDTWYGPRGMYRLCGSMLFGPGGRTWHNVSESDVELIVSQD